MGCSQHEWGGVSLLLSAQQNNGTQLERAGQQGQVLDFRISPCRRDHRKGPSPAVSASIKPKDFKQEVGFYPLHFRGLWVLTFYTHHHPLSLAHSFCLLGPITPWLHSPSDFSLTVMHLPDPRELLLPQRNLRVCASVGILRT